MGRKGIYHFLLVFYKILYAYMDFLYLVLYKKQSKRIVVGRFGEMMKKYYNTIQHNTHI